MSRIDLMLELLNCHTEQDWSDKIFSLARSHGFDQALIAVIPNKKNPLESAFLRSNYPSRWRETYDAEKLHYVDPTVKHCLGSATPLIWSPEIYETPKQKQFNEEACGYGLRSGITMPMHGVNGEFGVISFALDALSNQKTQRLIHHLMPELVLIRDYAFESSLRFAYQHKVQNMEINLSKRELECLSWWAGGKLATEIADIMNISVSGVHFHMQKLKRKLGVRTKHQTIARAILLGIVKP